MNDYKLIPLLREDNPQLRRTTDIFYVGVQEGVSPSYPMNRRKTNCFSAAPVYIYRDEPVFALPSKKKASENSVTLKFFTIPEREYKFIQPRKGANHANH